MIKDVPNPSFTPIRDEAAYAIYTIKALLPVTVQWPSCRETLAIVCYPYPPYHALESLSSPDRAEAGLVYELDLLPTDSTSSAMASQSPH